MDVGASSLSIGATTPVPSIETPSEETVSSEAPSSPNSEVFVRSPNNDFQSNDPGGHNSERDVNVIQVSLAHLFLGFKR